MNTAVRILVTAGMGACLAGCAANLLGEAKMDPSSPVGPEAARLAKTNRAYPKFADIPPTPTDVRPVRQFGKAAAAVEQARADLERNTAPSAWTLNGTDTFASRAQSALGPETAPAPATDTEAFAAALRKRATPPPPTPR
jgi:hypothetical protein